MAQVAGRRTEPIGRALCVGVSAGADAGAFAALALERGFVEPALLMEAQATREAVRAKLREMAEISEPGDLFLLTFSGHGGRTRVRVGEDELEEVGTWQLYDGTLNSQQLVMDLAQFRRGVRVLVVADNCGGGIPGRRSPQSPGGSEEEAAPRLSRPAIEGFLKSSILVLAACQEGKHADGPNLPGHFTDAMLRTLKAFSGTHEAFYQALCREMPPYQKPDYYRLGIPDPAFESQPPFTI